MSTPSDARPDPGLPSLAGQRALVWGLGVFGGGAAVVRHLCQRGARVRVLDQKSPQALAASLEELADLELDLRLGRDHVAEDFSEVDLVVKSPAIPPRVAWLGQLLERGVPVSSEIALALEQVCQPYVAVTGSKGKSTTATLLGAMLQQDAPRGAVVAGNNERPLLNALASEPALQQAATGEPLALVLELSSFMGDALRHARAQGTRFAAPRVLAFTSLCPEHLNWHETLEHYYGSKLALLELGPEAVVAPAREAEVQARLSGVPTAQRFRSGLELEDPRPFEVCVQEGWAVELQPVGEALRLFPLEELALLGRHNLENALLAALAARRAGASPESIRAGVSGFRALGHRLEPVAQRADGLRFINDSTATTPEAAIAALAAVPAPVVLLAGGSDKGADYGALAEACWEHAASVVCLGANGERIADAIEAARQASGRGAEAGPRVLRCEGSFEQAFAEGLALCAAGVSLLLSPAAASYDMFANFKARGLRFAELARAACAGGATA